MTLERAEPVGVFTNTVFAVLGGDNTTLLGSVARLGGIIVTEPLGVDDPESRARATGKRVAKVVEWVRHAQSHEHAHAHSHQSHDHHDHHGHGDHHDQSVGRLGRGTKKPRAIARGFFGLSRTVLIDKFDGYWLLDQTGPDATFEEEANGLPAALAVIERPVVDVHADEGVGLGAIEAASVLHRVVERSRPMLQSIRYAVVKMARNLPRHRLAQVLSHDVAAEWEGQAGLAKPPLAEVLDEVQAVVGEGELALVDQQADVDLAGDDGVLDLIERRGDGLEIRLE